MDLFDQHLYELAAAMEQWTDMRILHVDDLEDLLAFHLYLPKLLSQKGLRLQGFSCRQANGNTRLCLKVKEGDTPLVAFVTSATTIGSMGRLFNLLLHDRLTWNRDKYPWI